MSHHSYSRVKGDPCEGKVEVTERSNSFPPLCRWEWDGQGEQAERAVWLHEAVLLSLCEQLVSVLPALALTMPSEKNRKTAFIETLHSKGGW